MHRWHHLPLIGALALVVSSCGAPDPGGPGQAAAAPPEPTATATPTPTPMPTATPTTAPTQELVSAVPPASCPITQPPDPPFVPPEPYPTTTDSTFLYGTPQLWTELRDDGVWRSLPYYDGAYTQKTFWWKEGYSWVDEPQPDLTITGQRLDAPAPPFQAEDATHAIASDIGAAMLVGISMPTPGCWEITGRTPEAELTYVVWIASSPPK